MTHRQLIALNIADATRADLLSVPAKLVACGLGHVLLSDGKQLWGFGGSSMGQLGIGDTFIRSDAPATIPHSSSSIAAIRCGWNHSVILSSTLR